MSTLPEKKLDHFIAKNKIRRIVILSPHMDDAVLSCGGLMAGHSKKIPILVVTFATKDPVFINREESEFLRKIDLAPPRIRIAEEKRALKKVGARLKELGFEDGVYRRGRDGKLLYPDRLFNYRTVPAKDRKTLVAAERKLKRLLKRNDLLLFPMGFGGHIDHVLCRTVGHKLKISKLAYEDFPYTVWQKIKISRKSYSFEYDLAKKITLIKIYKTQIKMLFGKTKNISKMLIQRTKKPIEFYRLID